MAERINEQPVQKDITQALRDLDQTQEEIRGRLEVPKPVAQPKLTITRPMERRPYFVRY